MTDEFTITVQEKGAERNFTAQLLQQGYSHKFKILIGHTDVFFEPDDQGGYRAIKMPGQDEKELDKIDRSLLLLIQQKIEQILA